MLPILVLTGKTCYTERVINAESAISNIVIQKISEIYVENSDWKNLFGVPNSTHCDFRNYLLSQGWTEVYDNAIVSAY